MRIASAQTSLSSETPMRRIESSRFSARQSELNLSNENALRLRDNAMHRCISLSRASAFVSLSAAVGVLLLTPSRSLAQQESRPAFVIIERTATTGEESIQEQYAKLAREILPRYGARYLARSQRNALLEGEGSAPCCMAVLEFPNIDAVHRWYDSPENQSAAKVRQSGARFRIIAIEGLPSQK
jgi:uncharacterized protein (DUF1330 family)